MKYSVTHNFARFRLLSSIYNALFRAGSLTGGGSCITPLVPHCCSSCPALANVVIIALTVIPLSSLLQKLLLWGGILSCLLKWVISLIFLYKMPFHVN